MVATIWCLVSLLAGFAAAANFSNPVLWQDYPDLDVFRIGNVFYYSSSTFAFSPGAPVLKSYDLVNWEPVTHSVPQLNFGPAYNLQNGSSAYVKGIWASTLRYRSSNDMFYWMGCVESSKTYIWTAAGTNAGKNNGEVTNWNWTSHAPINTCYYDCGLLIDDDDKMYVVYGQTKISVAQLSADGLSQVKTTLVYTASETIEGSHLYKINGSYYIIPTRPATAEWVLKASNLLGPYEKRVLVSSISGPLTQAGYAHQGGIVDTPGGNWYYVAFMDSYPGGRIPVVAPLTWSADGWPSLVTDHGAWGRTYPMPLVTNKTTVTSLALSDDFRGDALSDHWEWNHNPDKTKWKLAGGADGGLLLQTADVTTDLFAARNTLTRRIQGPKSTGTFRLDVSGMTDGDRAGASLFRDRAAYIGVTKDGNTSTIIMVDGVTMSEGSWKTTGQSKVEATGPKVAANTTDVWLRVEADITPSFNTNTERTTTFSYSLDGKNFTKLGPAFSMTNSYRFFTGYRYGVFNFATKKLGGQVRVKSFEMDVAE